MKWIEALKAWNSDKQVWCIPRKGTPEYDEVRALMGPAAPKAPKARKAPAAKAPAAFEKPRGPAGRRLPSKPLEAMDIKELVAEFLVKHGHAADDYEAFGRITKGKPWAGLPGKSNREKLELIVRHMRKTGQRHADF